MENYVFGIDVALAFDPATDLGRIVKKGLDIVLVWMFTSVLNSAVRTIFEIIYKKRQSTGQPLKGFMQVIQIVLWCVAIIVIISILITHLN